MSNVLRRVTQWSIFRRPVVGLSNRRAHNPLPGYLDAGSYRDRVSPAGHQMLNNRHRETCDCCLLLRAQRNCPPNGTRRSFKSARSGMSTKRKHERECTATVPPSAPSQRVRSQHINMAPNTRSARRRLNQDCPLSSSKAVLERRTARLPLHAAASPQARALPLG